MLDNKDITGQGIKFLKFDADSADEPEPESEVPQWIDERPRAYRFYEEPVLPNTGCIIELIEELYKFGKIRSQLEEEYRIARRDSEGYYAV